MSQPEESQPSQPEAAPNPAPVPLELILLSPFQVPTQSSLYLANEDVACFLHGHAALWHPALILESSAPPRVATPYDHEQPTAGHVYAVPEHPPLLLPDDWDFRVKEAGAFAFRAAVDRATTFGNLREAVAKFGDARPRAADVQRLLDLPADKVAPFLGLGFGYLHLGALAEAMNHENLLDKTGFWSDLQKAADAILANADPQEHLKSAAQRLMTAREVLYPVTLHLVDLVLLNQQNLSQEFPAALQLGIPTNVIASALLLEAMGHAHPDRLEILKGCLKEGKAEVCGGIYLDREDDLLPLESQLWNLTTGMSVCEEILGQPVKVHARQRFSFHPQLPTLLQAAGLTRTLFLSYDESSLPTHNSIVVSWPSTDGKQVDAFCRAPHAAHSPQTYFHAAHYLHQTIQQDHVATLALLHSEPACDFYRDWLELSRLAPVLGTWTTLTHYFDEVSAGEYASPAAADDFRGDHLSERTAQPDAVDPYSYSSAKENRPKLFWATEESHKHPISAFAAHARTRRRIDAAWTFAGLYRSLAGKNDDKHFTDRLTAIEDRIELAAPSLGKDPEADTLLENLLRETGEALAERLLSRADPNRQGYLLLNPCSFSRRVALEIPGFPNPIPVADPVKACQIVDGVGHLVVEVPPLGFAWFPRPTSSGTPMKSRMKLADDRCVRNEFLEAEIDPQTGGLKRLSDMRLRMPRLGMQLVYNPGSTPKVKQVRTTSTGPAFGEIVVEGELVNEHDEHLAEFRQRFRAWLGRPVLDIRIELTPKESPHGYPWHAYYGCRFAWRDDRAFLVRGTNSIGYPTHQTRPETPDFIDVRQGKLTTAILTGGLPFHQRQGGRMLDVILLPEGEEARTFELALGIDRDHPALTANGMISPALLLPVAKGPPHIGATGWLYHLDLPNLLLTTLRPAPGQADAVLPRLIELGHHGTHAELRCVRNPARTQQINLKGEDLHSPGGNEDCIYLDPAQGELINLRVDYTLDDPPPAAPEPTD